MHDHTGLNHYVGNTVHKICQTGFIQVTYLGTYTMVLYWFYLGTYTMGVSKDGP